MTLTSKPVGYIYLVTNLVNGKKYVGCTKGPIKRRWAQHRSEASKGSPNLFHKAIRKYGPDGFTVEVIETIEGLHADLMAAEIHHIAVLGCLTPNGYNCTLGGQGVDYAVPGLREKHLEAVRAITSTQEWLTQNAESNRRLVLTPAWRKAHLAGVQERSANPEWQKNVAEANRERSKDPLWQEAMAEGMLRRNASPTWAASVSARTCTQIKSAAFQKAAHLNAEKARTAHAASVAARDTHLTPDERATKAKQRAKWRKNAARCAARKKALVQGSQECQT